MYIEITITLTVTSKYGTKLAEWKRDPEIVIHIRLDRKSVLVNNELVVNFFCSLLVRKRKNEGKAQPK